MQLFFAIYTFSILKHPLMDVEYKWILCQGKNCRQFMLLTWNSRIGQFVHPWERKRWGKKIVILAR